MKFKDGNISTRMEASLLSWERGLKYLVYILFRLDHMVAPLVGAWIEMLNNCFVHSCNKSLLSWERGLKSSDMLVDAWFDCRSSRGSVD